MSDYDNEKREKRNALKIITVDNKEIICDFTNTISGNSQSNASKSIMKSPTEEREINVPADAIKIEGMELSRLSKVKTM